MAGQRRGGRWGRREKAMPKPPRGSVVMGRRIASALVGAVALMLGPGSASAFGYNTVPCWSWDDSGSFAVLKAKPRKCTLGGRYGYQQVDLVKMAWRSWPGDSAFGRGISRANMGVSSKVRVKLYRRVRWEENTYRFTRARFNFNGQGWGPPLVLRID
jgi:hypothetical protein